MWHTHVTYVEGIIISLEKALCLIFTEQRIRDDSHENPEGQVMQSESLLWFPLVHPRYLRSVCDKRVFRAVQNISQQAVRDR